MKSKDNKAVGLLVWVSLIGILGALVFTLTFGKLGGKISLHRLYGVDAQVAGVEVLIFDENDLNGYLANRGIVARQELQRLEEQYASCIRHSQNATGAPGSALGLVGDVAMNAMTLGMWSLAKRQQDRKTALWAAQRTQWLMSVWPTAAFYFKELPKQKAVARVLTNNDGSFSVVLPRYRQYVVAAHTLYKTEELPDPRWKEKNYAEKSYEFHLPKKESYWLLRSTLGAVGDKHIAMTEDNMTDSAASQNLLKASCYSLMP